MGKSTIELRTCAALEGQRFVREATAADGSFLLRAAAINGTCLAANMHKAGPFGAASKSLILAQCAQMNRWRLRRQSGQPDQLLHVASGSCLDAGDEKKPMLYPCHTGTVARKQRFEVVGPFSWVRLRAAWEDNGRRRFFELCLDHSTEPPLDVALQQCDAVRERGVRWRLLNQQVPPETRLWRRAVKRPKSLPPLGGEAMPPRVS